MHEKRYEVAGKFNQKAETTGWIIGPEGASCTQTCENNGLVCLESELENHNEEVDTSEELVELIQKLGGNLSTNTCNENYGSQPNTPCFSPSYQKYCYASSKQNKAYDCDAMPDMTVTAQKKARVCYCIKGNLNT